MLRHGYAALALLIIASAACEAPPAAGPEVTIKLGGKFCEMYPDALASALEQVSGVEAVDLEKEGYAIVTGQAGAMSLTDLEEAVNGVRGEGWYCEAERLE